MADVLTQIQDCLDQLLIQMFASVRYIDSHHPYVSIPGQADQFTPPSDTQQTLINTQPSHTQPAGTQASTALEATQQQTQNPGEQQVATGFDPIPDPPSLFRDRLIELAQDLVLKEQQIEALVGALPGIGNSQGAQEARLKELQGELKRVEEERDEWVGVREEIASRLDGWIVGGVKRV